MIIFYINAYHYEEYLKKNYIMGENDQLSE